MPASDTEIANDALGRLGISPIMELSDDSKQAQFAKRFFDQTREEVLAARPWTFAIKRANLNALSTAPVSEWQYAYQLPSDFLRLVQINNDEIETIKFKYAIEGRTIVTDESPITICYVARVTDPTLYSPLFSEAFALKLASKLVGPLTGALKLSMDYLALYEKAITTPQVGEQQGRAKRDKGTAFNAVEIANTALVMLGAPPITSFSDASTQAQLAERLYDLTRDEVLESRPWTFATKRSTLTRASNPTGSEWLYSYTLPSDYLRLIQINKDEVATIQNKYAIEGNNLLTDAASVEAIYVARITDATLYSPLFVETLTTKLALKMAGPLLQGQKPELVRTLMLSLEKLTATPQSGEALKRANRKQSATVDEVEIVNMSLAMLGVSPIVSMLDPSASAQLANRFYAPTRDEVLESRNWTFAIKRATLTGTANSAFSEWAFTYTLPSDYLRLIQIDKDEVETIQSKYALEGNKLLSDRVGIEICYVAKVTQVDLYSPLFVEALATKLAIKLAGPLQKPDMVKQLFLTYAKIQETPQAGEQRKRTNRVVGAGINSLEIANNALAMLGVTPITSFGDQSIQAQLADRFYEPTRDEVMVSHPWNFAIRRSNLNASATAPLFEWEKSYDLPADCIRVLQLNNYDPAISIQSYAVEAGKVMTNEPTAQIKYVARVTDTAGYPPLFVEALTVKLATKLAGPLGKMEMIGMLTEQYERLTGPKARLMDVFEAKEKTRIAWIDSRIVRSRRTGVY